MKQLTEQHKKYVWIGIGVVVFVHFFLPRAISAFHRNSAHAVVTRPLPIRQAPAPPPPPSPETIAANKYGGIWEGDTLMPNANRCAVHLEVRLSDDAPKRLKGYGTVRCMPLQVLARGPVSRGAANDMVRNYASPASAVMTAIPQNGGVTFTIDQTVSASSGNCSITGFGITDFGDNKVMADWQEGNCDSGKMLLTKRR